MANTSGIFKSWGRETSPPTHTKKPGNLRAVVKYAVPYLTYTNILIKQTQRCKLYKIVPFDILIEFTNINFKDLQIPGADQGQF